MITCDQTQTSDATSKTTLKRNHPDTYLQFLHFSPNSIPFPHTMHVWDIQYFVENLQAARKEPRTLKNKT